MHPFTMERKECSAGFNEYVENPEVPKDSKKRDRSSIKQRFSDEQIRLLETIFESETKLEPRKKAQLASELGLQPRQVAIWFQNRRARWRSKQIEQEYKVLKEKYDDLVSKFESLKEERQSLLIQLQAVNVQMEEAQNTNKDNKGMENASIHGNSVTVVKDHGWTAMPSFSLEAEQDKNVLSQDSRNRIYGFSTEDALGYLNISDSEDCSLASIDRWPSDNVFDQPCKTSNWVDFWT